MTLAQLKRQMMADRRKLATLGGLFLFGLLLWGRMLWREVPRTATATPSSIASARPADNPGGARAAFVARKVVEAAISSQMKRDLFALHPVHYPLPIESATGEVEKSVLKPADDLEQRRLKVLAEGKALKLQTTLLGASPRALIQGQLLAVGQRIEGFEIVEIRSRRVVLVKDGVNVELEM